MALDALAVGIQTKKVSWLLDADIRGFFDTLDHEWLIRFVEHRIADNRVLRHLQKGLNAGVMEEGKRTRQEEGTPPGGSISPHRASADDYQTDARKTSGSEADPATMHAPAHQRRGKMARPGCEWPLSILRRAP
jgi:retron-type reverse transcriptase